MDTEETDSLINGVYLETLIRLTVSTAGDFLKVNLITREQCCIAW